MTSLATHVSVFLRERLPLEPRASERTCDTYDLALRLFFEFGAQKLKIRPSALTLEQLDAPLVLEFLAHLETQRHNGPATRNVRLTAIRTFMRFIEYREPSALQHVQRIRAIPMKRADMPLVDYLNREEMQALLDAPNPNTREGVRDRAMLHVAYAAGLRVSELVCLRLDYLAFDPALSIHVLGKGRRERALPVWRETGTAAQNCPSLSTKSISPHCLRHSCAMTVLQSTGDIRKVALWLGHGQHPNDRDISTSRHHDLASSAEYHHSADASQGTFPSTGSTHRPAQGTVVRTLCGVQDGARQAFACSAPSHSAE
jgi:site-specific recombinase XerD